MALWDTRRASLQMISQDLKWHADFIVKLFGILDTMIDRFQTIETPYAETCGMLALKGRNLCLVLFAAILDGLSHVSTGLVGEIMEMTVWMDYLFNNPSIAKELSILGFPRSGEVFYKIQIDLHTALETLEYKATDFGFTQESLYLPLDKNNQPWVKTQVHEKADLIKQLGLVAVLLIRIIQKCSDCLKVENSVDEQLDDEVATLFHRAATAFLFL